ncbi:MAG: plastocyanin/azurin family copper-binding protein [Steroidobacteraceae bacterium]
MIRRIVLIGSALLCCIAATSSGLQVVRQQDRKFSVATLHVRVGETIVFVNDDPYVHNIFSMSDAQSFDLGAFGKGESRKLTLKNPGKIEVGCAIHPEMKLTIEVSNPK